MRNRFSGTYYLQILIPILELKTKNNKMQESMKKLLFIPLFFFPTFVFSQFFVEYGTGYELSLNGFKDPYKIVSVDDYQMTREPFLQRIQEPDEMYFIYLPTGEGIVNYLYGGYNIDKYVSIKLGFGTNLNKLNFNSLNQRNAYTMFENTDERGTINTEDYYYFYQKAQKQLTYNIYNINPVIGLHYPYKNIKFGANIGVSYSFFDLKIHKDIYRYGLSGVRDGYYEYSYETLCTIKNKKAIVSLKLGLDLEYNISSNVSFILNFSFNKLKYTPKVGLYEVYNIHENYFGEIKDIPDVSENLVLVDYETIVESRYDQIFDYNFSTIGFTIGVRYIFGERHPKD